MTSNNKHGIKYIVLLFVPLFAAIFIQYLVSFTDVIILFIKNVIQDKALSKNESASSVIKADYDSVPNTAAMFAAQYLLYVITFGIWYYISFVNKNQLTTEDGEKIYGIRALSYRIYNSLKKLALPTVILIIIAGILCQTYTDAILALVKDAAPKLFEDYDQMIERVTGAYSSPLMLFTVFIIAPIGEELMFRGLIFNFSKKVFNPAISIVVNGLLFALYHGNLIQGCYAFVFGMILAALTQRFASIIPGILFHIAVNSSILVVQDSWFRSTTGCITALVISLTAFVIIFILLMRDKRVDAKDIDKADSEEADVTEEKNGNDKE